MDANKLIELKLTKFECLDHGYVQLLDVMGDDKAVVDAARLSVSGYNVKTVSEDRGLIRYLMRHRHTTPFEMVVFKFMIKLPIFAERQLIRHRMASTNEMSARYGELPEEYYVPDQNNIQYQATLNKQGRSEKTMNFAGVVQSEFRDEATVAFRFYKERLENGMARELARINLPLSTYTQKVWKIDLHNLFHFLSLRLDKHAQFEIRVFAEAMAKIVRQVCPLSWEAFEDFRLNAVTFSGPEMEILQMFLNGLEATAMSRIDELPTKREAEEFRAKVNLLRSEVPRFELQS